MTEGQLASMSITINTLLPIDGASDKYLGSVTHNGQTFDAVIVGAFCRLESLLRTNVTAEYELDEIISAETGLQKNDSVSGIFPLANGQIVIDGSVHNETMVDDKSSWLDVYIQNGADFFAVASENLRHKPAVGSRIRIVGTGLRVYPTFT